MLDHEDIFRTGLALLAFVVAFYAVIARERKTPYILNSIYAITYVVLIALLLSLASKVTEPKPKPVFFGSSFGTNCPLPAYSFVLGTNAPIQGFALALVAVSETNACPCSTAQPFSWQASISKSLNYFAALILSLGIVYIFYRVWRIQNRQINFRDDQLQYTIPPFVMYRRIRQKLRRQKAYEHNPGKLSPELIDSLKKSSAIPPKKLDEALKHSGNEQEFSTSASFLVSTHMEADRTMADLAIRFIDHGCSVQYTTCSRHPVEFLKYLKREWTNQHQGQDWNTVKNQVVVIDGYTPHFGFTDTIYTEWSNAALQDCLDCIMSQPTYAGVHTAIANAFNKTKKHSNKQTPRTPALLIYEGSHALVDLESNEQYRIFIRHVIPSERLWGGMFTIFVESSVSSANLSVLKEVTDIFVDRQNKGADEPTKE